MAKKTEKIFIDHINRYNYDIRVSRNARWIDQKCTPDVIAAVVDSILRYMEDTCNETFTSKDIWKSEYARNLVQSVFKKVDPHSPQATNEYDKYYQQPMKMLAYAGILIEDHREGNQIVFKINNMDALELLEYEQNALEFLNIYITKVLTDSGLYPSFERFFSEQTKDSFIALKQDFEKFTHENTPISNIKEPRRIFTKVLNPLAYMKNLHGTEKGRMSPREIQKYDLMYNRDNFRDVDKPKGMTRQEYAKIHPRDNFSCDAVKYYSEKAKKFVRKYNEEYNSGKPEIASLEEVTSLQIHHMFSVSDCQELAAYPENLIALTPNQHMTQAHPNNNTNVVDPKYRCKCLLTKLETIRKDEVNEILEYDFNQFKKVLAIGFGVPDFINIPGLDYDTIGNMIREICKTGYEFEEVRV